MTPKSKEEYEVRFAGNTWIDGEGLEVAVHIPCPFCAAPDFMVAKLLEVEMVMKLERVCVECSRGVRLQLKEVRIPSVSSEIGVSYEFLQTQGDDPPPWCPPMRRLERETGGDA